MINTLNFPWNSKNNHSRDYYRGKSFHFSGAWKQGVHYINDEYSIDFVTHKGCLLACAKGHFSDSINEPKDFIIDGSGQTIGINSIYWDFILSGVDASVISEIQETIAEIQESLNNKQDTISDLDDIRAGSIAGSTAIQSVKTIADQSIKGSGNITVDLDIKSEKCLGLRLNGTLVANQEFKTINNTPVIGSGNISVQTPISDLSDIRSGAAAGATAVQPGALANYVAKTQPFTNPVGPWRPDPCFWRADDGYFYVKGTGSANTVLRTGDFVHYKNTGRTFISADAVSWLNTTYGHYATDDPSYLLTPHHWAPQVIKIGSNWVLYMAIVERTGTKAAPENGTAHIVAFTSRTPYGDFSNPVTIVSDNEVKASATSSTKWNNVIDPFVYCDPDDNKLYLIGGSSYAVRRVRLTDDGLALAAETYAQHVAGQSIITSPNRETVYEGAYLYKHIHNGTTYWYLFVSAGHYDQRDYCLRVGRSTKASGVTSGTAVNYYGKEGASMCNGGGTLILSTENNESPFWGPGHIGGIFESADGRTFMLYHCHDGNGTYDRKLFIQELFWDAEGWPYFGNSGHPVESGDVSLDIITETTDILNASVPFTQEQADWEQSDSSAVDYIKNKPTIPSVSGKADKVQSPTAGNFAGLDNTGNITDSGKKASDFATAGRVADIEAKIPTQASSSNQLADKNFVNSSIQTETATFRGNYACWCELPISGNNLPDNNDYAVLVRSNDRIQPFIEDPDMPVVAEDLFYINGIVYKATEDIIGPFDSNKAVKVGELGKYYGDIDSIFEYPFKYVAYGIASSQWAGRRTYFRIVDWDEVTEEGVSPDDANWVDANWQYVGDFRFIPDEEFATFRWKYSGNWETNGIEGWSIEYKINDTPLTAAQLAALNSDITKSLTTKLQNLPSKPVDTAAQTLTEAEKAQARANIGVTGGGVVRLKAYFAYSEEDGYLVYDHGDVTSTDQIMGLVAAGKLPVLDVYIMEEGEPDPAVANMSLPYVGALNDGVGVAEEDWTVEFQFAYEFGYAYKVYFVMSDGALAGYFANEMKRSEAFVTDIIEDMECSEQDIIDLFNE